MKTSITNKQLITAIEEILKVIVTNKPEQYPSRETWVEDQAKLIDNAASYANILNNNVTSIAVDEYLPEASQFKSEFYWYALNKVLVENFMGEHAYDLSCAISAEDMYARIRSAIKFVNAVMRIGYYVSSPATNADQLSGATKALTNYAYYGMQFTDADLLGVVSPLNVRTITEHITNSDWAKNMLVVMVKHNIAEISSTEE